LTLQSISEGHPLHSGLLRCWIRPSPRAPRLLVAGLLARESCVRPESRATKSPSDSTRRSEPDRLHHIRGANEHSNGVETRLKVGSIRTLQDTLEARPGLRSDTREGLVLFTERPVKPSRCPETRGLPARSNRVAAETTHRPEPDRLHHIRGANEQSKGLKPESKWAEFDADFDSVPDAHGGPSNGFVLLTGRRVF
jgi:hypothetical protein